MVKYGFLHVHSMFSIHDSATSPAALVKHAKELGAANITLTDHGTLFGIDDFMDAGKKYDINTIPGVEAYIPEHLLLFAKDYQGYQDISRAVRDSHEHQVIKKIKNKQLVFPIMKEEILEKYFLGNTHVYATSACVSGPLAKILLRNKQIESTRDKALAKLEKYQDAVTLYETYYPLYDEVSAKISDISEQIAEYKQYTKSSYKKKIEKRQEALDKLLKEKIHGQQLTLLDTPETSLEQQIENTRKEIKEMESMILHATNMIQTLSEAEERLKKEKSEYQLIKSKTKDKYAKYQKLRDDINQIELYDEKILYAEAKERALYFKRIFPNFFIEVQYHGFSDEAYVMPILVRLAKELDIPIIAANDAHMADGSEESIMARQIVRYNYLQQHQSVEDSDRELYLKTDEQLAKTLSYIIGEDAALEAIENLSVLNNCHVIFPEEKHYPKANLDKSIDDLVAEAREKKIEQGEWTEKHEKQLPYELEVIKSMGYVDYHMVVRDFCFMARKLGCIPKNELSNIPLNFDKIDEWLHKKQFRSGIGVGPGRGSAVGSLVCYLLGITNVDPIKYNLLFERFLNPERVSMPDIDSDIKTSLRPIIIRYLKWKYGERAVCSIMTQTTYAAKGAIQMVGRDRADELYGHLPKKEKDIQKKEYAKIISEISGIIPEEAGATLKKSESIFQSNFKQNEEAKLIWSRAKLIEGVLAGTGLHAGGVVISDNENVNDYVPLAWNDENQVWATQCDMNRVEQKGLLKMDLLGLNTLDVISDCVQYIERRHGIIIDLDHLPFEDEVFENIYATGRTNSVFQVESEGMKAMLKEFKPTCFEDIILLIAAYRPGPMQYLEDGSIIGVKNGTRPTTYKVPELQKILAPTYSAIIYQEQVMQIFQSLAGYSLGAADMVRRAMSKKKTDKLVKERTAFVHGDNSRNIVGCVANGIDEETANKLFDEMVDFAKYAFNKSHAATYAVVSYQTAWLKYHYPVEYLTAMFNNKDQEDFGPIIEDCKMYNIQLLPPDINHSYEEFIIEGDDIRYGLIGIKGIGAEAHPIIDSFISSRSGAVSENPYISFLDFISRNACEKDEGVSVPAKRIMDPLIFAGVFDCFIPNREALHKIYLNTLDLAKNCTNITLYQQEIMNVNTSDKDLPADEPFNIQKEIELLGTIVSTDPLKGYKEPKAYNCVPINKLQSGENAIFGFVVSTTSKLSKKGKPMLLIELEGVGGKAIVIFMNESCQRYENMNLEGKIVKIYCCNSNGTLFGRKLEYLKAYSDSYSIEIDTIEEFNRVGEIIKNQLEQGDDDLYIRTSFYKGQQLERPKVFGPTKITAEVAWKIGATKL